jgi:Flp pilus assembly protein TadG
MEFALIMPILLIVMLLVVDLAFALDRRAMVQHAVREGARHAAVENDVATVTNHTSEQSGGILSNIEVCYVDENGNGNPGNAGDSVRVSGEYTYSFIIGNGTLLSGAIPDLLMTPTSEARLEKTVFGATSC